MKMIVVVCPRGRVQELRTLMSEQGVHAYSELPQVTGEGRSGKRLGTHAWPATSVLIFSVLPDEKREMMLAALRDVAAKLYPEETLRAFVLPVEDVL